MTSAVSSGSLRRCRVCGQTLPENRFQLLSGGCRRRVCYGCRYQYAVLPSRRRKALRDAENRQRYFTDCQ